MKEPKAVEAIAWHGDAERGVVRMLEQRDLPQRETYHELLTLEEVATAIEEMTVRGAPAIGIAAAMGLVLGLRAAPEDALAEHFKAARERLSKTRPTAVNLFWALERMQAAFEEHQPKGRDHLVAALHEEAVAIHREDIAMNRQMGAHGAQLFEPGQRILTHCNAGALATGGYGTALGVIRALAERDGRKGPKAPKVWVDETRPYLQGARLTAWELLAEGIQATLISDNMAAHFMQRGEVDAVIIGADRIAANGDVANKIGSYGLAVLAQHHGIPFYVAAPSSTLDAATATGAEIIIEERSAQEVTQIGTTIIAPRGIAVRHPAFDVTPNAMITAIITEQGVHQAPYAF